MYSQNNEDEIILDYFKLNYPENEGVRTMILEQMMVKHSPTVCYL